MRSSRVASSLVVMVLTLLAGAWLTRDMSAQGQRSGGAGAIDAPSPPAAASTAGPLERTAKPITPDNPVPRRTYSLLPEYPPEAAGSNLSATLTFRATLDQTGRVAEVRQTSVLPVASSNEAILRAFGRAGIEALRQWQYESPAMAPISFWVQFTFAPGGNARVVWHDSTAPAGAFSTAGGAPPPPPPPPPSPPFPPEVVAGAIRIGGNIAAPMKIKDVKPAYPPIAQSAKVSGVVILEAVIGADGKVLDVRVVRSVPLLDQAAIDAVRQWEFRPVLMNGVPARVIMTMTVNFTLS
ncbi:MAG TPA: energy transducer TonB [Vicinamibacterales bacterium]|nr:energy transducer TonB [Vicinamibacterales bacterium]